MVIILWIVCSAVFLGCMLSTLSDELDAKAKKRQAQAAEVRRHREMIEMFHGSSDEEYRRRLDEIFPRRRGWEGRKNNV